jgi:hypothetical protein
VSPSGTVAPTTAEKRARGEERGEHGEDEHHPSPGESEGTVSEDDDRSTERAAEDDDEHVSAQRAHARPRHDGVHEQRGRRGRARSDRNARQHN